MKILIIDDSELDCELLSHSLRSSFKRNTLYSNLPLTINSISTLNEGIQLLESENYDLIFLDLILEGDKEDSSFLESPLRALEEIKKTEIKIPIIIMTSYENPAVWLKAIQSGAQDYILKEDFSSHDLLKAIGHALEKFKLEEELKLKFKELETYSNKLEESNNELEEFAYVASHDLQEPLRKIIVFGKKIQEEFGDEINDTAQDYLNRMCSASERMQVLLDDLLEYSRVANRDYEYHSLNLETIILAALSNLENQIKSNSAKNNLKIANDINIDCEEILLERVFQNLISNSLKYRKEDIVPEIAIEAKLNKDQVQIDFIDNGIGFENEFKDKIFQQFQRLHGRSEYSGTGMGLATVKKIIEKHSGDIEVDSSPGKGSKFTLNIPVHQT